MYGFVSRSRTHSRKWLEAVVRKNVDSLETHTGSCKQRWSGRLAIKLAYPVVGFQIVDLLPEHQYPHVFTQELDSVQCIGEARAISGEPVMIAISEHAVIGLCGRVSGALPTFQRDLVQPDIPRSPTFDVQYPAAHPRLYALCHRRETSPDPRLFCRPWVPFQ